MEYLNKIKYIFQDYNVHFNNTFAKFKKNKIKAFWCRANNFGDWLTPEILKFYGLTPIFTCAYDADIISVGSIMEQIPHLYDGIILGTGMIKEESKLTFPNANIIGVRGILTKERLNINSKILFGDPGLLISNIVKKNNSKVKNYKLGILPHISDKESNIIKQYLRNKYIKIIDPQQNPKAVAKDILNCSCILSSSLHGLIFADSYGIPNRRITITDRLTGGDFKFLDYYSILQENELPIKHLSGNEEIEVLISYCTLKDKKIISNLKKNLNSEFKNLAKKFYETT